jgi:thiamine-monophosphate kinase
VPSSEKALIAAIRRRVKSTTAGRGLNAAVKAGIGDDCAVLRLPASHETLVTTDFSLEEMHFRREWHPADSVGHRCLARGLSDIAAMGGKPVAAFLSLALPRDLPQGWVKDFIGGLLRLAEKYGVTLNGGDTAESPRGVLADIVVVGSVPKGKAILRSGARPGDRIYVSGELGGSAAAIAQLRAHPKKKLKTSDYRRHFYPEPRVKLGQILREKSLATAMIDLSDGLSTDLAHICEESGVGAEIEEASIPRARVGKPAREVDLDLALHGGEDYELLFTAPAGKRVPSEMAGAEITFIGRVTRSKKVLLRDGSGIGRGFEARGWEHFRPERG